MLSKFSNGPTPRQWLILITIFVGMLIPWVWLFLIMILPTIEQSAKRTQDGKHSNNCSSDGDSNLP